MTEPTSFALRPLTHFSPSPTNPRTRMSTAEVQSLAESIAEHEVMQPILARPRPGALDGEAPFEIVAGHRRWQACSMLAVGQRSPHGEAIPSLIRELTDAQVLAMQLVENIQREDLHPLDEAEHYRRMREDATAPASVEDIARVGKVSISRVYERLSLLQLVPAAREAFLSELLSLKTALQVARMTPALQAEITVHLSDWGGEPMSPKAAAAFIRDRYMLRLAQAPFKTDDADLVPDAGACTTCPKRTGANPQLFGDITEADTCTDTICFAAKKAAQHSNLVDELRTTGYTVLEGDQARDACTPDGRNLKPGWLPLEGPVPYTLGDADLKVADVLDRAAVPHQDVMVIDHPGNKSLVYAVGTGTLEQALRKIKASRAQLDKAAERTQQAKAPPPQAAPSPKASAAPAAPVDASKGPQGAASLREEFDNRVHDLIMFKPPATSGGKYGHQTAAEYRAEQHRRAFGMLAGAEVAWKTRHETAEGLPSLRTAQMILVLLMWCDAYYKLHEACVLCGIEPPYDPASSKSQNHFRLHDETQWAWDLPDDEAERLVMVLLASQDHDGKTALQFFAEAACDSLGIATEPLSAKADEVITKCLQLGAMDAAKPKAGKPGDLDKGPATGRTKLLPKYRCAATGSTWSGRGLQPVWLKTALASGKKLTDFAV